MKSGRHFFLEVGLILCVMVASVLFGSVYSWASLFLCAVLFLLLPLCPEAFLVFRSLPRVFKIGIPIVFGVILFQRLVTSYNHYGTEIELLKWLAFSAAFLLIQCLPQSSLFRLLAVLAFVGLSESVYGLFEVWTAHEKVLWQTKEAHLGFVTGTYLNRDHLAGLMELCLGAHLGLLFAAIKQGRRKVAITLSLFLLVTLIGFFQTGSRMGVVSFAFSFLLLTTFLMRVPGPTSLRFAVLVLILAGIAFLSGRQMLLLRWEEVVEGLENWSGGRTFVWRDAIAMLQNHPWVGTGLGSFEWAFPSYQSGSLLMGWSHAHNDYLELAVELGIPGLVMLLVSFGSLWLHCWNRRPPFDSALFPLFWGCLISTISFAVHGLTDFNFSIPANVLIFIILFAVTLRLTELSHQPVEVFGG